MEKAFECFDLEQTIRQIAEALGVGRARFARAVELLDAGNTIPFIARYRKEATQGLDEIALRGDRGRPEQGPRTGPAQDDDPQDDRPAGATDRPNCARRSRPATTSRRSRHLYLPFKPKRRTRATIARERGLQPLADLLLRAGDAEPLARRRAAAVRLDPTRKCPTRRPPGGALAISWPRQWSEDVETRAAGCVQQAADYGQVASQVKRGKKEEAKKFEMYFDYQEPVKRIPSHRLLAMKRGEAEGLLRVELELDDEFVLRQAQAATCVHNPQFEFHRELLATGRRLLRAVADAGHGIGRDAAAERKGRRRGDRRVRQEPPRTAAGAARGTARHDRHRSRLPHRLQAGRGRRHGQVPRKQNDLSHAAAQRHRRGGRRRCAN